MSYLIYNDYKASIQNINLMQVLGGDLSILDKYQRSAEEKAVSHLKQKYMTEAEFTSTTRWSPLKTYSGADRVYLDAAAYAAGSNYLVQDLCLQSGSVYICTGATTGAFDATKWSLIGAQYDMFYVSYPYALFDINTPYLRGTQIFWAGKVWTATEDSAANDTLNIQYVQYASVPPINSMPGDVNYPRQWGAGVAYTVAAGTLPTDTAKWTAGDNRSQGMVDTISDMVIYYIHKRITPQNIPANRKEAYNDALDWLINCATGDTITAPLPRRQPNRGNRIRYGGNIKNQNSY